MVFIINGYLGSGKDTFVTMVSKLWKEWRYRLGLDTTEVINISTIDYLKDIFKKEFNWDGNKTPQARRALSVIHNELALWNDIPFVLTSEKIKKEQSKGNIVFVHCREPENIFKYSCAFGAPTIFIKNDNAKRAVLSGSQKLTKSDTEVENYKYNIIIDNNSTFENLEKQAENFIIEQIGDI